MSHSVCFFFPPSKHAQEKMHFFFSIKIINKITTVLQSWFSSNVLQIVFFCMTQGSQALPRGILFESLQSDIDNESQIISTEAGTPPPPRAASLHEPIFIFMCISFLTCTTRQVNASPYKMDEHRLIMCFCVLGQLRQPHFPLLGPVWRSRRLRGSRGGVASPPPPHRAAPSGGDGHPVRAGPPAAHLLERGARPLAPPAPQSHVELSRPHQGCFPTGSRRHARVAERPAHALLRREESVAREPGRRRHWECVQRHGNSTTYCSVCFFPPYRPSNKNFKQSIFQHENNGTILRWFFYVPLEGALVPVVTWHDLHNNR